MYNTWFWPVIFIYHIIVGEWWRNWIETVDAHRFLPFSFYKYREQQYKSKKNILFYSLKNIIL